MKLENCNKNRGEYESDLCNNEYYLSSGKLGLRNKKFRSTKDLNS